METISKHHRKLVAQYQQSAASADIVASAKHLACLVLASKELLTKHRKKMLSEVLWLISEADGKYSTRYRSVEVVRLASKEPNSSTKIQHEHVFPRKKITERILQNPALLDQLLSETVACVVTEQEHKCLKNSKEGWQRYEEVPVYDMSTNPPSLKT